MAETLHARVRGAHRSEWGDFLLGEGYRLLAEWACPMPEGEAPERRGPRTSQPCAWVRAVGLRSMRMPTPVTVREVLDIFRMKTAPAFEVALSLGAILAGCDEQFHEVLRLFSESLGIAYQIRDDLDDLRSPA